jgi:hypothetical protein
VPRAWNDLHWNGDPPGLVELVASRKTIAWEQVPVTGSRSHHPDVD